jgi:hypothetical protein
MILLFVAAALMLALVVVAASLDLPQPVVTAPLAGRQTNGSNGSAAATAGASSAPIGAGGIGSSSLDP